jgi:hypothetical protein
MLNMLQHYQKYYTTQQNKPKIQPNHCQHNNYPKFRICSQCTKVSPGNQGIPSYENNVPDKQIQIQKQNNNSWIGVL